MGYYIGIGMNDLEVNCLLYAEDSFLLGSTPSELQTLITVLNNNYKNMGLQLNAKKTTVLYWKGIQK